jgi:tRNA G10  N-methylase Trm11
MTVELIKGDAIELMSGFNERPDLIVTDPPYAFGGSGDEHAISATVAVTLREAAQKLAKGRWMIVMCAASWRSTSYMVEAVRGIVEPVRVATWCKPTVRTKTRTTGWQWASVNVVAMRKGKAADKTPADVLDHILAPPIINGRRAELPPEVADWMVAPFAVPGGLLLDPVAGSGAILHAGARAGMRAVGFEKSPLEVAA